MLMFMSISNLEVDLLFGWGTVPGGDRSGRGYEAAAFARAGVLRCLEVGAQSSSGSFQKQVVLF